AGGAARRNRHVGLLDSMRTILTRPIRSTIALLLLPVFAGTALARQPHTTQPPTGTRGGTPTSPGGAAPPPLPPVPPATPVGGALPTTPPLPGEQEALRECKKYPVNKK